MRIGVGLGVTAPACLGGAAGDVTPQVFRTEGDSLMDGAYGNQTRTEIANVSGWTVEDTSVGGATMSDIRGRILASENAGLLPYTTIIWDGSSNGLSTVESYVDLLEEAIDALGHTRFVVIPPINSYGATWAGSTGEAVAAEMQSRWPNNFLHWADFLAHTDYAIDQDQFHDAPTDVWHLSAAGALNAGQGIVSFMAERGWYTHNKDDWALSAGSVWLFDVTRGAFEDTPATAEVIPNVAWQEAAALVGSGNATTLGTYVTVMDTDSGDDLIVERTGKGGLHAILGQHEAYTGQNQQGVLLQPHSLIQSYVDGVVDEDWYFSVWFQITRNTQATNARQSVMHKAQSTGAFHFHMAELTPAPTAGGNFLARFGVPGLLNYAGQQGAPQLRAVGVTGYTGTQPALQNSGLGNGGRGVTVALGAADAWAFFNDGVAASIIVYRAYAENLTESGRDFDEVAAIDRAMFRAAFTGGRFASDTYSEPNTVMPYDEVAPTLSSPAGSSASDVSAEIAADTDEDNGIFYGVVTQSSTTPSAAQVIAGQDHTGAAADGADSETVDATGTRTLIVGGLDAETTYYGHMVHVDAVGNISNVVSSTSFTTESARAPDFVVDVIGYTGSSIQNWEFTSLDLTKIKAGDLVVAVVNWEVGGATNIANISVDGVFDLAEELKASQPVYPGAGFHNLSGVWSGIATGNGGASDTMDVNALSLIDLVGVSLFVLPGSAWTEVWSGGTNGTNNTVLSLSPSWSGDAVSFFGFCDGQPSHTISWVGATEVQDEPTAGAGSTISAAANLTAGTAPGTLSATASGTFNRGAIVGIAYQESE